MDTLAREKLQGSHPPVGRLFPSCPALARHCSAVFLLLPPPKDRPRTGDGLLYIGYIAWEAPFYFYVPPAGFAGWAATRSSGPCNNLGEEAGSEAKAAAHTLRGAACLRDRLCDAGGEDPDTPLPSHVTCQPSRALHTPMYRLWNASKQRKAPRRGSAWSVRMRRGRGWRMGKIGGADE